MRNPGASAYRLLNPDSCDDKKSRTGFLIVKLNINTKPGDASNVMMAGFATARWFALRDGKITD